MPLGSPSSNQASNSCSFRSNNSVCPSVLRRRSWSAWLLARAVANLCPWRMMSPPYCSFEVSFLAFLHYLYQSWLTPFDESGIWQIFHREMSRSHWAARIRTRQSVWLSRTCSLSWLDKLTSWARDWIYARALWSEFSSQAGPKRNHSQQTCWSGVFGGGIFCLHPIAACSSFEACLFVSTGLDFPWLKTAFSQLESCYY